MFVVNHKQIINSDIYKYIKEYTNKWTINLISLQKEKHSNNFPHIIVSDLVKHKNEDTKLPDNFLIIPFVSLISFLAGYKFVNLFRK